MNSVVGQRRILTSVQPPNANGAASDATLVNNSVPRSSRAIIPFGYLHPAIGFDPWTSPLGYLQRASTSPTSDHHNRRRGTASQELWSEYSEVQLRIQVFVFYLTLLELQVTNFLFTQFLLDGYPAPAITQPLSPRGILRTWKEDSGTEAPTWVQKKILMREVTSEYAVGCAILMACRTENAAVVSSP
jgi:hypothetical protein